MRIYDDKEKRQENVLQNVSISYESRNFHYPVADAEIDEGSGSGPPHTEGKANCFAFLYMEQAQGTDSPFPVRSTPKESPERPVLVSLHS